VREGPLPGKDWIACQAQRCIEKVYGEEECSQFLISHQRYHLKQQQEEEEGERKDKIFRSLP
jgi:hypothetical protein